MGNEAAGSSITVARVPLVRAGKDATGRSVATLRMRKDHEARDEKARCGRFTFSYSILCDIIS
jgi:hypothetical protein